MIMHQYLNDETELDAERLVMIVLALFEMAKQDFIRGDYATAAQSSRDAAELLDLLPKAMRAEAQAIALRH